MEPQVDVCFKRNKNRRCNIDLVIFIVSVLITFVVGLIIGSLTGFVDFLGIGALVLFATTLAIILIVRIVMLLCNRCC